MDAPHTPELPELRRQEIHRLVNRHALATPPGRKAVHCDPLHHALIHQLRDLLTAVDLAMKIEGVSRESRDRVIHTLVYGESPSGSVWPDPEAALERITLNERLIHDLMTARPAFAPPTPQQADHPTERE